MYTYIHTYACMCVYVFPTAHPPLPRPILSCTAALGECHSLASPHGTSKGQSGRAELTSTRVNPIYIDMSGSTRIYAFIDLFTGRRVTRP